MIDTLSSAVLAWLLTYLIHSTALLVQGLPELAHGRLAAVPEQAEDGELPLGDLVTIRHERSLDLQV